MQHSIRIIGGGNMGGAIAKALHASPDFSVHVIETDAARRSAFAVLGIPAHATLDEAPAADGYLLAIKPQQFAEFAPILTRNLGGTSPLLISIMAGIPLAALQAISPHALRAMPNLPALIHESMSVLCAPSLDDASRAMAEKLFTSIGAVAWVEDEAALHAVTAISGSGPAYVFAFMEALENAATAQGLSPELARQLVQQTVRGAALLADQSTEQFSRLREQVTSKGGTTEAALQAFSEGQFSSLVDTAIKAASARSSALSGQ